MKPADSRRTKAANGNGLPLGHLGKQLHGLSGIGAFPQLLLVTLGEGTESCRIVQALGFDQFKSRALGATIGSQTSIKSNCA